MVLCSTDGRYEYNDKKEQWWDKFQQQWTSEEAKKDMEFSCYGDSDEDVSAMTSTSGDFRGLEHWYAVRTWQPGKPYPRKKDYVTMRTAVPNVIDACKVHLEKFLSSPRFNGDELRKIAQPDFKLEGGMNKADYLLRLPVSTFFHEVRDSKTLFCIPHWCFGSAKYLLIF